MKNTPISLMIWVGFLVGWVLNILKLADTHPTHTAAIILRFIGVFFFHLGGILGYL
jgi:hypothetical protein